MKSLNRILSIAVLLSFGLFISACEKKAVEKAESASPTPKTAKPMPKSGSESGHGHAHTSGSHMMADGTKMEGSKKIVVAKNGTKFDPSIAPADLPDDAWACVMGGKVHYARMEKGDGKCEICKMNLSQQNKDGADKKGTDEKAGDHGDHQH